MKYSAHETSPVMQSGEFSLWFD